MIFYREFVDPAPVGKEEWRARDNESVASLLAQSSEYAVELCELAHLDDPEFQTERCGRRLGVCQMRWIERSAHITQ